MIIDALIAARAGSERVKHKNTRPFAGSSLLERKIAQLLPVPGIRRVVVSSEDNGILLTAKKAGAVPMRRDAKHAASDIPMSEVYAAMAGQMDCDAIFYANCTSPLVSRATVEKALSIWSEAIVWTGDSDSLNTVTPVKEFLWLDGKPVNYDPQAMPPSQFLPDIVAINFAVSIIHRETMIERKNVVGWEPFLMPVSEIEGWDIDTELDFRLAEFLAEDQV